MYDAQVFYANCKEPVVIMGRWLGNSGATPTVVAKTTRPVGPGTSGQLQILWNSTGNLTVTMPSPVGTIQNYLFDVQSSNAHCKVVKVAPPSAGVFTLQVVYAANDVAVDLVNTEELTAFIVTTLAPNP